LWRESTEWEKAAGGDVETLMTTDIQMETVTKVRAETPFLKDRKPWLFKPGQGC
jgi:hypothetical protein